MFLVARTSDDPLQLAGAAREQVWALDANQPIAEITAMSTAVAEALRQPRFSTVLLSVFAFVALALAAIGVYSIMAYSVSQRTREVGIRMALGAEHRDVLQSVLGQGMKLAGIGLALGLVGAFGISRVLASMLYEVSATDPLTFACVAAVLAGVALFACYVPARRATRIDPLLAIRSE
jgi:putative ABC transport system permease protein